MDQTRKNSVKIVGRLVAADFKTGNRKDNGQGYISGTATIKSVLGGASKEYEVQFYANEQTQDKKTNKLYTSYSKMNDLIGKKVEVTGELRENRYYSKNAKQLVSAQQISGRFVRGVAESVEDEASFELGGFITSELTERKNKNGEIYRYDLALGQADYAGKMMAQFVLHVRPTDTEIINGVKNTYKAGDTVILNGQLDWTVETVTKESENSAFGAGAVHTFTNRTRSFWIRGGSPVITKDEDGKYSQSFIQELVGAYKARDVEIANSAEKDTKDDVEDKPVVSARQTSLI